ncbi:LacI family DNA-binding transcriptional regulator [Thermogemmatispora onikobensis]|uniref:LacI family DNA-binding transcriptional regulator n=1 Tax=Thermogemmatispora onikobensis TaxID=732234 RepID=UPI0008539140|nr:substrate-binding domain-containing protein [Thermogemmatispora onikobensis]
MPSIREVAERAGVSLGTVSNVLNHPELVAEETRQRVQRIIDELGFVRNGSARQLRAGRSLYIGLVVLDVANPFFTEVARGVEDAASEAGYVVILCNSDDSFEREAHYLRVLEEQRAHGVLITPVLDDPTHLYRLRKRGISVVLLDRPSRQPDLCSVAVDDVHGGELAAEHLLAQGHERIAFVNGPQSIRQCADRLEGVQRAVRAAGADPAQVILEVARPFLNAREGERAVEQILSVSEAERPTAIFCANDLLALGVMRGLTRRGFAIPRDFALVGYDDVDFAGMLSTPLTSVRQPKYQLGRSAAELLLDEADHPSTHEHRQLTYQPELIVRESSSYRRPQGSYFTRPPVSPTSP